MNWKRRLSKRFKGVAVYVILDKELCAKQLFQIAASVVKAEPALIQYRDKTSSDRKFLLNATRIQNICRKFRIPFIVNDRIKVALKINADGVHLGQDDLPVLLAKKLFKNKIIGTTCKSLRAAKTAIKEGADYFGVGGIFKTDTKKNNKRTSLKTLKAISSLGKPTFAIGGINQDNLKTLVKNGIKNIVVGSAICKAKNPFLMTKEIKGILNDNK